ncbi:FtsW/RodA/SpoVE family cell cycle protein [Candidatus Saccharibacteria bacterium]|nr:FtsW/RodA/SpoVE family cell cycle protein [Candidatus Saccharibacteria bacterium]
MRKHKSDRIIGIITIILLIFGLVVIYAIGPMRANFMNAAYGSNYSENYFFIHQLVAVVISLIAFFVAFKFPYEKLRKISKVMIGLGILACVLLEVFVLIDSPLASCQLGACRWIRVGEFGTIQPAEILKLGLVLYLAQLAAERKKEGKLEKNDFWVPFTVVGCLAILFVVYFQQDLGSTVVIVAIMMAILFMSGMSAKKIGIVVAILAAFGVVAVLISPHRMERLLTFTSSDGADTYHIDNALLAIGTGGMTGVGVGNTVQATGYLPESINDSVFAVMGETFGFLGLMVVLGSFTILLFRILKLVEFCGEEEYGLVAAGVFAWVASHVVINIAAMTGLIPLTGITLPLLSYGGTSLAFTSFGLGLVLQLSCYSRRKIKEEKLTTISTRGVQV